jgi:signal transduction histidine kinase
MDAGRRGHRVRLADFIEAEKADILSDWDAFASTLGPSARGMDQAALRDHAAEILDAIALDLRTAQTAQQQTDKSKGNAARASGARSAAETHAVHRATSRFTIRQLVSEYRALRACVLHRWRTSLPALDVEHLNDIERFNEAIDQAVAESVDFFATEVDRWRHIFLGVLGHDLRGPLNAILLTAQLLSSKANDTPFGDDTKRLVRSGERMRELLDDLLDYSRTSLEAGIAVHRQTIDLNAVCRDEIDLLQTALGRQDLRFSGPMEPVFGFWDGSRVRQALANLVSNACTHGIQNAPIEVDLESAEEWATLRVRNSGAPVSAEELTDLFEPLRRRSGPGSAEASSHLGLGLFIVREIVRGHKGTVSVESSLGRTTFTLVLPRGA